MTDDPTPTQASVQPAEIAEKKTGPGQSQCAQEAIKKEACEAVLAQALRDLMRDILAEQRTARRWRVGLRVAWLLFFVTLLGLGLQQNGGSRPITGPHTAMIEIQGEIAVGAPASADAVISSARSVFETPEAKALVLLINSPGGSPVQAGLINDEIRRLKALHKKPVYAVVEESAASAAYYIAVAADAIYVDKASIVGSIGVLMDGFGFTGLMDKLGIERRLMTAGEHKGFLDPFSPQTPRERELAQAMLNQIHQQFIAVVRQGRGDRLKETPDTFSGLFWNGQQAVEMGLVDGLGSLDFVAREIVKAEDVVDYTQRENVAERLVKRFGMALGAGMVQAARTMPSLR
ncbi:MAG: S49 family peptidase [Rhodoferax sp.]